MARGIEQALVLMLAAQVNEGPHARGELADARDRAVHTHAAAPVCTHAAGDREAREIPWALEEAPLRDSALLALAHEGRIRPFSDKELQG